MATSNNTIKTRIQLKSDTEANWNKAGPKEGTNGFIPLLGELIVYIPDATHPFSRLKVGDGQTNIVSLPFIDSGTLNGNETEIVKATDFQSFPSPGSEDKLYIDLTTKNIYHYTNNNGYNLLSNFKYNATKDVVGSVTAWLQDIPAHAEIENNTLKITNGIASNLYWGNKLVVTDIVKED